MYICICYRFPKLELYRVPDPPLSHLLKGVFLNLFNLYRPESRAGQKLCGSPVPLLPPHLLASA